MWHRYEPARRGKDYYLSGTKSFISNAGIADCYVVFATTEPKKKAKASALS
jgi:alkylation response protein AidB-like acyl-CoA dehydrogenase